MKLSIEEKINQWRNDVSRQAFVRAYQKWDIWLTIKELDLTVYKFELSPNQWLVAIEYKKDWNPTGTGAYYYIHNPQKFFQPYRKERYELTTLLKEEKMRLLAEKRAEAKK